MQDDETVLNVYRPPLWLGMAGVPFEGVLAPHIQGQIGRELRTMYDDLVQQPVPDHLLALVNRLDHLDR